MSKREDEEVVVYTMWPAVKRDWCHICGKRDHPAVGIDHTTNAEHTRLRIPGRNVQRQHTRICRACALEVVRLTSEEEMLAEDRKPVESIA